MARAKTGKLAIERAQRQEKVLQLRLAGATIREIAARLSIPRSTVQRDLVSTVGELTREPAEQVVDMELGRLDRMLLGIWKDATAGDVKAIDRALKIMERRAKYLNLDSAVAPDTSEESRKALDELHNAIVASAMSFATPEELALMGGTDSDDDEDDESDESDE
jgi:hypothetical protein